MIDVQVFPILIPAIDFNMLLQMCASHLQYSPSKKMDDSRIEVKSISGYLRLLEQIENKDADVRRTFREVKPLLNQISFSFLVIAQPVVLKRLSYWYNNVVPEGYNFAIIHATLLRFRERIGMACDESTSMFELRAIHDKIILLLEQAGFSDLFHNYSKKQLEDGTFALVHN